MIKYGQSNITKAFGVYMKHRKLFITLIAIFSFFVCLGTFIMIWFWGDTYKDFGDFIQSAEIPGLDDDAVPQGIANYRSVIYDEAGKATSNYQDYLFVSAYMKDNKPSRIYVTGTKTGYIGYVTVKNEDGSDYNGHCGGIATSCVRKSTSGMLWITSDDTVFCAKRSSDEYGNIAEEIIAKAKLSKDSNAENTIAFTSSFNANCNASFCFYYDSDGNPDTFSASGDKLYVGEFYRKDNYETDPLHHVTTKNGTQNRAFVYEYTMNTSSKYGLSTLSANNIPEENRVPKIQYIYSIPDKIQGFARIKDTSASSATNSGKLVLSQSWGLPNSTLYCYDWIDIRSNYASYSSLVKRNVDGKEVASEFKYEGVKTTYGNDYYENPTVYFVDDSSLVRKYSVPSMSEGLCASGDRVFVLFESASYKYRTFVRQQLRNIYSFIPR